MAEEYAYRMSGRTGDPTQSEPEVAPQPVSYGAPSYRRGFASGLDLALRLATARDDIPSVIHLLARAANEAHELVDSPEFVKDIQKTIADRAQGR